MPAQESGSGFAAGLIPALGGKTPRQAARLVRGRRQLDLLLREMENTESRLPEWDRVINA